MNRVEYRIKALIMSSIVLMAAALWFGRPVRSFAAEEEGGIVQVLIVYQFDDGSYDVWASAPGYAVGEHAVITSPDMACEISGDALSEYVSAREKSYLENLGLDLSDEEVLAAGVRYKVYAGGDSMMSAALKGSSAHEALFETVASQGTWFSVADEAYTAGGTLYALGVLSGDTAQGRFYGPGDTLWQALDYVEFTDEKNVAFTADSDEFFMFCPVIDENGTVVAHITSFSEGKGTAEQPAAMRALLASSGLEYEEAGATIEETTAQETTGETEGAAITEAEEAAVTTGRKAETKTVLVYLLSILFFAGAGVLIALIIRSYKKDDESEPESGLMDNVKAKIRGVKRKIEKTERKEPGREASVKSERPLGMLGHVAEAEEEEEEYGATQILESADTEEHYLRSEDGTQTAVGAKLRIGQSRQSCDLVIANKTVSHNHCEILKVGNEYFIVDLNSTNKTKLNGEVLTPEKRYSVKPDDRIVISNLAFTFV